MPFVSPVVLPPVLVTRASTSKALRPMTSTALRPFAAPAEFLLSTMLGPLYMCGFIFLPSQPIGCLAGAASGPWRRAADVHDRAGGERIDRQCAGRGRGPRRAGHVLRVIPVGAQFPGLHAKCIGIFPLQRDAVWKRAPKYGHFGDLAVCVEQDVQHSVDGGVSDPQPVTRRRGEYRR